MTKAIFPALAALAFAATPALAQDSAQDSTPAEDAVPEMTKGEKKLAKLLEGRVAGEPESCIRDRPVRRFHVIDRTAIVYRVGRTVWVNRTRNPDSIDDSDTLVFRRFGTRLCSSDIVTTIDRHGGFYTGNIFLDKFVPYRLPKKEG